MSRLQALLLDLDGVIVDSEYYDYINQVTFINEINKSYNQIEVCKDYPGLVGKSYEGLKRELCLLTGNRIEPEVLWQLYLKYDLHNKSNINYKDIFRSDINDLLHFAKRNRISTAIVSSSPKAHIEDVISVCGIKDDIDVIISGADLPHSKPDPAVYLKALKQLGISPVSAVAIEDSACGITSAVKAGIPVIAYEETRLPVNQTEANWIVKSFAEALSVIASLC